MPAAPAPASTATRPSPRPPWPDVRAPERRRRRLPGGGRAVLRRLVGRLDGTDRFVLQVYVCTRVGLFVTGYCVGWLFPANSRAKRAPGLLSVWEQWDWTHFRHIAEYGYFGPAPGYADGLENEEAFFPGFPLALRAVHAVVPDWVAAGLVISLGSGAVAMLALARVARLAGAGRGAGQGAAVPLPGVGAGVGVGVDAVARRAVLVVLLSPCAVFLAAGYSESLFLAFALPAWLAARSGRWPLAATLAACATATRVSGLFLAAALAVDFLLARDGRRDWRRLPWLTLPALPALAYTLYLYDRTGDWMAWKHAQERGWYRTFHPPWEAWGNTWGAAFDGRYATGYALMSQAELAAMVVGLALLGGLLWRRRWPEAVYIALNLWALGTSYWYTSVPRATLLWWPLWTGLAVWSLRAPWRAYAGLCVLAPLSTLFAVTFLSGRWAG
ncbi:mannosyltransferase family protein [Streptomyces flavofungini]|uniref:Integral membrane protein n=1 Tax=Streptomyces flavofungini TaxID=68200 RepID=A0ABS0X143_9ACTN|nr:mannosyltransferase family protein [Streptomyces flavofungini]MBJ3806897.1 hypothetical protein [Streptomyces flavofungini]GHC59842.1 hypothetical protein GCM10010349_28750 [Streptomyces flavofungini]